MRKIDFIVVHTAASYDSKLKRVVHQVAKQIHDYHVKVNKWEKGGYHAYIQQDGLVSRDPEFTRRDDEQGAHVGGFNTNTLGVCVSGHGDFEPFNPAQLDALVRLCADWCEKYGLQARHVIGHRETDDHGGPPVAKTCPGVRIDMDAIREAVGDLLALRRLSIEARLARLEERVRRLEQAS
jgi:N-acetylmuramoyl-L-alanine amidase